MPIKWINYLPHLAAVLLLGAALWLAYRNGFQTAYNEQQLVIKQAQKDHAAVLLASAEAFTAELKKAQQAQDEQAAKTQAVGVRLAQAQADVRRLKQQHKTGIKHAIEQDKTAAGNACIDGLGVNGLRQYRQALGYGAD
ncbi:hypothetical protein [Neisseria dumasiana]|uniref:DUF2514 domain-containing protein n=1 Tax=Neisseria dumasiana TaxID=1931275 RepID=A0A1X3DMH0_9NEIS|nr:hypothetical protein [Neisseria dumasiana]OSI25080.1 hypothetical protein BV912_01510 [Neisseria dumasiana]